MDRRCVLCRALLDQENGSRPPNVENTKLMESARFVVMPCIGPFVPGHILVVSREHHPNLLSMGPEALEEYDDLSKRITDKCPFSEGGVLEAEHGAVEGDKAGACVVHAHVHWLPGLAPRARMFDDVLPAVLTDARMSDLSAVEGPYILTRANLEHVSVYRASGLRSQMIRRTLCEDLGRTDENWKAAPRPEWVQETVNRWKAAS
jgi:diadenosine tetraphosphate (Ap4A) HIT family hydrolase